MVVAPPYTLVVDIGLVLVGKTDHRHIACHIGNSIELCEHRESLVFESDCRIICILRRTGISDRSGVVVIYYTIAVEVNNIVVTRQFLSVIGIMLWRTVNIVVCLHHTFVEVRVCLSDGISCSTLISWLQGCIVLDDYLILGMSHIHVSP